MTIWQDDEDAEHFFRQIDANNWKEVFNETRYVTYELVGSPSSQTINLFASDRNVYIQLKCGLSTWGNFLSTITQYGLNYGYWTDDNGSNFCNHSGGEEN